ncbi:sterol carrier family protein [Nocardioides sp.]|uniref:sterol carrier family protein n=1 Tax=Nocardioides sp. TaxID=35761 RepID=UPI002BC77183|nr:sterol carrier family protein [Nocardioides sp.]HSX66546.1 sterol carrier family protein [Nocardioides sp.]
MPPRQRPVDPAAVAAAWQARRDGTAQRAEVKLLVKETLSLLERRAPGHSVEVRVPPYGAVQAVEGGRHTRGTPRAVVETDAATWLAIAAGELSWHEALDSGALRASGERTDLTAYLPLVAPAGPSTAG